MIKKTLAALLISMAVASVNGDIVGKNATGLEWNAPTTNVDGSPLTDLAGYRLYQDDQLIADVAVENYQWVTIPLAHGATGVFYVTAYDEAGNESEPSASLSLTADLVSPSTPTSIAITINISIQ
jgi:hypothetical protein